MINTTIHHLISKCELKEFHQVNWGTAFREKKQGIYVVSTSNKANDHIGISKTPNFNDTMIQHWINKLPEFSIDKGEKPTLITLKKRLSEFWLPDESIIYIGKAPARSSGSGIGKRVSEYYRTEIGNGGPHAGGQWIKVLNNISSFTVYYAPCDEPAIVEEKMLKIFMSNVSPETLQTLRDKERPLPFANLRLRQLVDKNHGLEKQRL